MHFSQKKIHFSTNPSGKHTKKVFFQRHKVTINNAVFSQPKKKRSLAQDSIREKGFMGVDVEIPLPFLGVTTDYKEAVISVKGTSGTCTADGVRMV